MSDDLDTFDLTGTEDLGGQAGIAVGMDWGGTNIRAGLVSFEPPTARVLSMDHHPWVPGTGPDEAVQQVARLVDELKAAAGVKEVDALGIGLASMVDPATGEVVNAPNLGWSIPEGTPLGLAHKLGRATGLPVALRNDLSAIAWGERCFGAGRGADTMLCVFLGTGLGAAYICDGRLVEGASGVAAELGHLRLRPGGHLCGCGQRGCVEAYVGGTHIRTRLGADLGPGGAGTSSLVARLSDTDPEGPNPSHADRAAAEGDGYAAALWDDVSGLLGAALAYAVTLLDPGLLVMGGTVWTRCPELRRRTTARLYDLANPSALRRLRIVEARLSDRAGVLGAAALAMTTR